MSVYAVERIKQVMEQRIAQTISPLVEASEITQLVGAMMADAGSAAAYQRELVFMGLRELIGSEAKNYADNLNDAAWVQALQGVGNMLEQGKIPALSTSYAADSWELPYLYATIFMMEQYAYGDVGIAPNDVVLDCGARFGEMGIWALHKGAGSVFAFESNPIAYDYVVNNALTFGQNKMKTVHAGLADKSATMQYTINEKVSEVPVITLDQWCAEYKVVPQFIKMYLEGNAPAALVGAQNIIQAHQPKLAITLSLNMSDMWNVPMIIKKLCPEYKLTCCKNAPLMEFVVYASL
ncbi:MAG: FkbM family methyltransferase [Desulfovibrionaceae bacterium]|nr:FkbM family methyltransferase [Desulfovibrionaceae bacterium]